jgi:hypothetical protein
MSSGFKGAPPLALPPLYNIPDVKEQLKCDNGASSSINIK